MANNLISIVKLNKTISNTLIYIKYDVLIDCYLGGNKVRLYEYSIEHVINHKAEKLIIFGKIKRKFINVIKFVNKFDGILLDSR